eukprot:14494619-Alexandrium_andersonii.AAC.1
MHGCPKGPRRLPAGPVGPPGGRTTPARLETCSRGAPEHPPPATASRTAGGPGLSRRPPAELLAVP